MDSAQAPAKPVDEMLAKLKHLKAKQAELLEELERISPDQPDIVIKGGLSVARVLTLEMSIEITHLIIDLERELLGL